MDSPTIVATIYHRESHNISRKKIDPDALKIMYRLIRYGHTAYLVGGGVRDILLKRTPKDFDIVTDATPSQIKRLFRNSRIIGRRFKLVHVFFGAKNIEVSTFRDTGQAMAPESGLITQEAPEQLFTDNQYGTELSDALRRDLTINALFYNPSDFTIIDYVGGMKDLADGVIRVIGNPETRFAEDPVRMIRAVRHSARTCFMLEKTCLAAIKAHSSLIHESSPVRVFDELKKDLASGYFSIILPLLQSTSLLQHLIPALAATQLTKGDSPLMAALEEADRRIRKGEDIPITVILSLIYFFLEDLPSRQPDCEITLASYFEALSLSRREKEVMTAMLETWFKLYTSDLGHKRPAFLAKRVILDELVVFAQIIAKTAFFEEVSNFVSEAMKIRQSQPSNVRKQRGRRAGRGPMRRSVDSRRVNR
jgi:poly(A) polymerase